MKRRTFLGGALATLAGCSTPGVKLDVPYVVTPYAVVEEMLRLAQLRPGELLYDLGCGDGRIVIAAAERFGARGVGVDIDPRRIAEAQAAAQRAGVGERVRFSVEDLFQTDFSQADVVTLYLFPELNDRLKPKLLRELRGGARIVSHQFGMAGWAPDDGANVRVGGDLHAVYLWRVPARPAAAG
jgi:SAM-dependent methyltransferase